MTFFLAQTASYASAESNGSSSLMVGMLILTVTLLGIMVVVLFNMSGRLRRLEIRLLQGTGKTSTATRAEEDTAIEIETSPGGAFETFLREDPERRKMPKREQFSAYRNWRKTNGLNWSDS